MPMFMTIFSFVFFCEFSYSFHYGNSWLWRCLFPEFKRGRLNWLNSSNSRFCLFVYITDTLWRKQLISLLITSSPNHSSSSELGSLMHRDDWQRHEAITKDGLSCRGNGDPHYFTIACFPILKSHLVHQVTQHQPTVTSCRIWMMYVTMDVFF